MEKVDRNSVKLFLDRNTPKSLAKPGKKSPTAVHNKTRSTEDDGLQAEAKGESSFKDLVHKIVKTNSELIAGFLDVA